jgi:hypothetical protein
LTLAHAALMHEHGMSRDEAIEALAGQPVPPALVEAGRRLLQGAADAEATRRYERRRKADGRPRRRPRGLRPIAQTASKRRGPTWLKPRAQT